MHRGMQMAVHAAALLLCLAASADRVREGTYTIRNVHAGKYLNVARGSMRRGANVQLWNNPGSTDSQWRLQLTADGTSYTIQSVRSGHYLNVVGGAKNNGANVWVWNNPNTPNSRWKISAIVSKDGTAYTLRSVGTGFFLNAAGGFTFNGTNVHMWNNPDSSESQWELFGDHCHDATIGEVCFNEIAGAEGDITLHPDLYPELRKESRRADFQAHLYYCWRACPLPCLLTGQHSCLLMSRFWDASQCGDALPGSRCRAEIDWAMQHGIHDYPDWYPNLDETSTVRQFQVRLFKGDARGFRDHGCLEPCCHDASEGELCYEDAMRAMKRSVDSPDSSHVYPPSLTGAANLAEFQAYLHLCFPEQCPEPCESTEMMSLQHNVTLDCPGSGFFV